MQHVGDLFHQPLTQAAPQLEPAGERARNLVVEMVGEHAANDAGRPRADVWLSEVLGSVGFH